MAVDNEELINRLYEAILLREATSEEKTYWVDQLDKELITPAGIILLGATTPEFAVNHRLAMLYQAAFGKYATIETLMSWRQIYDSGVDLATIGQQFIQSNEFKAAHPGLTSPADYIQEMAQAGLGRAATQAEVDALVPQINTGLLHYGTILGWIVDINQRNLGVGLAMLSAALDGGTPDDTAISGYGTDGAAAVSALLAASPFYTDTPTTPPPTPTPTITFTESNGQLLMEGILTGALVLDLGKGLLTMGGTAQTLTGGSLTASVSISAEGLSGSTVSFTGDDSAESYLASAAGDTIRGAGGNDSLTGGAGKDSFVLEATAAANGIDSISSFAIGAEGDVLNLSAFLNLTGTENIGAVDATSTAALAWSNGDVLVAVGEVLDEAAAVAALFGAGAPFAAPAGRGKAVVITADVVGDALVWYLVNQTDLANVTEDELSQVATLVGINNLALVGFDASNFA